MEWSVLKHVDSMHVVMDSGTGGIQQKPAATAVNNKQLISAVPNKVDATEGRQSVGSRLSALFAKIDCLAAPKTDKIDRQIGILCIRIAMYSMAARARPGSRKMRSLLSLSTARFEEECVLSEGEGAPPHHRQGGKAFVMKEVIAATIACPGIEEHEEDEEVLALRVLPEACFMAACQHHPFLVRLYGVAEDPVTGRFSIVMEHVGPDLLQVLRGQRHGVPFPERDACSIIRQVLTGAGALHERGVVHGAICPENVLFLRVADAHQDDENQLLVAKIGGAGQATSGTGNNDLCYTAPELLSSSGDSSSPPPPPPSHVTDSWSIGCLMAQLLTGEALFDDGCFDEESQLDQILNVLGLPPVTGHHIHMDNRRLHELVPPAVLSDDGFQVLHGLLTCDPSKRLTPAAALQLPWFNPG